MEFNYPKTVVIRHKRENLKKCSLRGLETRPDFTFHSYPLKELPLLENYLVLSFEGEPLTEQDRDSGLFIIDATWRYAEKMLKFAQSGNRFQPRSLPSHFRTAYPRRQEDCSDPEKGLASIEAIYIAYNILGRDVENLLDNYYWKEQFLEINSF